MNLDMYHGWTRNYYLHYFILILLSYQQWHSQKLIYLGKLLQDDHALVKEVFSVSIIKKTF